MMDFQAGAFIYINKPYRMSSFGALAHIRYVLSKRLHVKRDTQERSTPWLTVC